MDNATKSQTIWLAATLLVILWFFGLMSAYTLGGFLQVLLALSLVILFVRVLVGRRPF